MTLFDQILDLIGQPPGSLVYHILALAAVQFALMIALGQWLRDRDSGTARLTVGVAILFIARALLLIAALLVMSGQIPGNVVLPPVERAVDTITVLGLFWIFVTMDDPAILRRNFGADMIAGRPGVPRVPIEDAAVRDAGGYRGLPRRTEGALEPVEANHRGSPAEGHFYGLGSDATAEVDH